MQPILESSTLRYLMNFLSIYFVLTIGILDLTLWVSHALKIIDLEYEQALMYIKISVNIIRPYSQFLAKYVLKLICNMKLSKKSQIVPKCLYHILCINNVVDQKTELIKKQQVSYGLS